MKKKFEIPEIELVYFNNADIIRTSGDGEQGEGQGGNGDDWGGGTSNP